MLDKLASVDDQAKVREVGKVLDIPVYEGVLERVAERMTPGFDLISFNHVLEHVPALKDTLKRDRPRSRLESQLQQV